MKTKEITNGKGNIIDLTNITKQSMVKNTLFINRFTFNYPDKEVKIWISPKEKPNYTRFHFGKLPKELLELVNNLNNDNPFVWVNIEECEGDKSMFVKLEHYPAFAKYWFSKKINMYLKQKVRISKNNFNNDFEYWHEEKSFHTKNLLAFGKYTIKIETYKNSDIGNLWLSYEGLSYVLTINIEKLAIEYNLDTDLIKSVIYNKQVHHNKKLSDPIRFNTNRIYPVLGRGIADKLNLEYPHFTEKFKLTNTIGKIKMFFDTYLKANEFKKIIPHESEWSRVTDDSIYFLKNRSRDLQFGQGHINSNIYDGIKRYGSAGFVNYSKIKWFLIYLEKDQEKAEILKEFVSGKKGFTRLSAFTGRVAVNEKSLDIKIESGKNIMEEVDKQLKAMELDYDTAYFAFYLSPFQKTDPRLAEHGIYYRIKESLLKRDIMSQAIDINKFNENNFGLSMTNIGIAMTAKLGGVPWKLANDIDKELIIGFGAYRSKKIGIPYIGSAFCFDNMGIFQEFDCWPAKQEWALHTTLAEAIAKYRKKKPAIERVVIHYYKEMRQRDLRKIDELIDDLDEKIPVIVIRFNSSFNNSELIINPNHDKYLAENGCYVRLKNHQYLLHINSNENGSICKDAPFPLKLAFQSNRIGLLNDDKLVERLMKQVYEFCLLHWRSVKQPRIPVTVAYPRMVAEVFPWFSAEILPDAARKSLWFL